MPIQEEPRRLKPTIDTLRKLFAVSGNLCAYTDCPKTLFGPEGRFGAHVCHIESPVKGGPRFNPNMTNEERRAPSNLMLLCYDHHAEIDDVNNLRKFSTRRLREMKDAHEWRFINPASVISASEQFKDWDQTDMLVPPKNLHRFIKQRQYLLKDEEEWRSFIAPIQDAVRRLAKTPFQSRAVFELICEKIAEQIEQDVLPRPEHLNEMVFRTGLRLTHQEVMEYSTILQNYQLAGFEYEDLLPHERYLFVYTVEEYPFFIEVVRFAKAMGIEPSTYFNSLNFSSLDEPEWD